MKTLSVFLVLGLPALLLLNACRSSSCEDAGLVKIPSSDASAPELIWMVTRVAGGATPTSSVTPYSGADTTIVVKKGETVKVFLMARDEQSGIKQVKSTGDFTQICLSGNSVTSESGSLAEHSQNPTFIGRCVVVEWSLPEYDINTRYNSCPPWINFSDLIYFLRGTAENNKGGTATSNLLISVVP